MSLHQALKEEDWSEGGLSAAAGLDLHFLLPHRAHNPAIIVIIGAHTCCTRSSTYTSLEHEHDHSWHVGIVGNVGHSHGDYSLATRPCAFPWSLQTLPTTVEQTPPFLYILTHHSRFHAPDDAARRDHIRPKAAGLIASQNRRPFPFLT